MDVKELMSGLQGKPYNYIINRLSDMLARSVITSDEYADAFRMAQETSYAEPTMNVEELSKSENENFMTVAEYADDEVNTDVKTQAADSVLDEPSVENVVDSVDEPIVNAFGNVDTNDSADETPEETADESKEKNADETPTNDTAESQAEEQEEKTSENNNSNAQWVSDYQGYLQDWSDRNPERGIEELEAKESSLNVKFKDEVALKFSSPSNVSVKAKDPSSPKASDFDALMEVAKKSNQDINLSYDKMSESFRHALIEACAKSGVCIRNLQDEDIKLYADFVLQQRETNLNDDVEQVVDQEEQVVETADEHETPAETENDNTSEFDLNYDPEADKNYKDSDFDLDLNLDSNPSDEAPSSEEADEVIELPESLERPSEVAEPVVEEPVVNEPAAEEDEIVVEAAPKNTEEKSLLKRGWNGLKGKFLAVFGSAVIVGGGSAAVLAGCANKTANNDETDGYETFIDTTNSAPSDTTYVATADSLQQAADTTNVFSVPTEWNENMGISERDYNITRKACGDAWETMYTNAHLLKATLSTADNQMTEAQILLATRNIVAWTTSPNANGQAKINSGILKKYGLNNLVNALRCGDTLTVENITYYQSMLKAGNNDRLNLQVSYLAEINGRFAMLRHNSEGYLIGNTCNQFKEIGDCGKDAKFAMCDCGPNVTEHVEQVINQPQAPQVEQVQQQDTTKVNAPEVVEVPADTAQVEKAAPVQNVPGVSWVGGSYGFSANGNIIEATETIRNVNENSDIRQSIWVRGAMRRQARKLARTLAKEGRPLDENVVKALQKEIREPNSSRQEAQETLARRKAAAQNTANR